MDFLLWISLFPGVVNIFLYMKIKLLLGWIWKRTQQKQQQPQKKKKKIEMTESLHNILPLTNCCDISAERTTLSIKIHVKILRIVKRCQMCRVCTGISSISLFEQRERQKTSHEGLNGLVLCLFRLQLPFLFFHLIIGLELSSIASGIKTLKMTKWGWEERWRASTFTDDKIATSFGKIL